MHGTVYQDSKHVFDRWHNTLYEKRWHETIGFVRALKPVFFLLRGVWSEGKYAAAVDTAGVQFKASDEGATPNFDPRQMTETLHSAKFERYMEFILALKSIPEDLASWAEGCTCHSQYVGLEGVNKHSVLRCHFGSLITVCPMAGLRAPEMAHGEILQCFERVWELRAGEFLQSQAVSNSLAADVEILESDMQIGKASLHTNLTTKLDFWSRLPWYLAGVGHVDEEKGRECASRSLDMFAASPREVAHHRTTWGLLQPGAPFRIAMDLFIAGAPRNTLCPAALSQIAIFAFTPIIETTIEGKHAKVSLETQGGIGPVRVSLANRLPLLESRLQHDPSLAEKLVQEFSAMRHLKRIPALFAFHDHPHLLAQVPAHRSRCSSAYVKPSTEIIYRCDLHTLFKSLRPEYSKHVRTNNAHIRIQDRLHKEQNGGPKALSFGTLQGALMLDHFRSSCWHALLLSNTSQFRSVRRRVGSFSPCLRTLV
jgi:hypothetical protein